MKWMLIHKALRAANKRVSSKHQLLQLFFNLPTNTCTHQVSFPPPAASISSCLGSKPLLQPSVGQGIIILLHFRAFKLVLSVGSYPSQETKFYTYFHFCNNKSILQCLSLFRQAVATYQSWSQTELMISTALCSATLGDAGVHTHSSTAHTITYSA